MMPMKCQLCISVDISVEMYLKPKPNNRKRPNFCLLNRLSFGITMSGNATVRKCVVICRTPFESHISRSGKQCFTISLDEQVQNAWIGLQKKMAVIIIQQPDNIMTAASIDVKSLNSRVLNKRLQRAIADNFVRTRVEWYKGSDNQRSLFPCQCQSIEGWALESYSSLRLSLSLSHLFLWQAQSVVQYGCVFHVRKKPERDLQAHIPTALQQNRPILASWRVSSE